MSDHADAAARLHHLIESNTEITVEQYDSLHRDVDALVAERDEARRTVDGARVAGWILERNRLTARAEAAEADRDRLRRCLEREETMGSEGLARERVLAHERDEARRSAARFEDGVGTYRALYEAAEVDRDTYKRMVDDLQRDDRRIEADRDRYAAALREIADELEADSGDEWIEGLAAVARAALKDET